MLGGCSTAWPNPSFELDCWSDGVAYIAELLKERRVFQDLEHHELVPAMR